MAFKAAPTSTSFLVAALVGLILSVFWIPQYSISWAYAFGFLFLLMIISAFVSMTKATPDSQLGPRTKRKKVT